MAHLIGLRYEKVHSAYRGMWLLAMFDLPTGSKQQRRAYADFRKQLLAEGFIMFQYSVYGRYIESEKKAMPFSKRLEQQLPDEGEVRILAITDKQFSKMKVFSGRKKKQNEKKYKQINLF